MSLAGFEGAYFCDAAARPSPRDRPRPHRTERNVGRPYAGCFVNATVDIWPMANGSGLGIWAALTGVQFVKDGDAFTGGRPADPDEFDDLSDQGAEVDDLVG